MPTSVPKPTRSVPQISVADDIIAIEDAASLVSLKSFARCLEHSVQSRGPSSRVRHLVQEHQEESNVVELMPTAVQIRRATLNRFVSDQLLAWCRDDWLDASLDDVLIQATVLVE